MDWYKMEETIRFKRLMAVLLIIGIMLCYRQTQASVPPLKQIEVTVERILTLMKDDSLGVPEKKAERRSRIMSLIDSRFDFQEMSRITLGKTWRELSREEKADFTDIFSQLIKQTYISRIETFSDEKVEYSKEIFGKKKKTRAMVFTNILRNGGEAISINYKVVVKNDEWFVYDVVIEGVSLVRNYRTEFSRIVAKEKIPGLVKRIREKIEKNEPEDK